MGGVTIKKLARDIKMPVSKLIDTLADVGVDVSDEADTVTGQQQLLLSKKLNSMKAIKKNIDDISLDDIQSASELRELNDLLTHLMAKQKIQALIKEDNLDEVTEAILGLAEDEDGKGKLLAAAMLGRLAEVARSRKDRVYSRSSELLVDEPPSLVTLSDDREDVGDKDSDLGKTKLYAAMSLRHVEKVWVTDYCVREAIKIDTAENARRVLLDTALEDHNNISDWLVAVADQSSLLRSIEDLDARLKRDRRLFSALLESAKDWHGDLGDEPGLALANCLVSFIRGKVKDVEQDVLFRTMDSMLGILSRMIELRFSHALNADTYAVIEQGKSALGPGLWSRFLDDSEMIQRVRMNLLETALVLARQNRTDNQIMKVLLASYTSKPQASAAVKRHFTEARDLDPDVREWWESIGKTSESQRRVDHKVGNTEDEQLGALLIEVASNREAMDKVGRAVVPLLEISEPVLASTVKKAVSGYIDIAQIACRLARMRKLTKTDLKGERLEYNPLEHEMLGGHKPGIRRIKVVRDGIKKEFRGKIKTLVKPRVEPEE